MRVKFLGAEAKQHRIEAFSGAASLEGITRAATLAAHYAATENVRFRAPYSDEIEFYLYAPEPGSLSFPLDAISNITSAVSAKKAKFAASLFLTMLARGSGQLETAETIEVGGTSIPSGDLDALTEAATPGLERAHRWIDLENKRITVGTSQQNIQFDLGTKEYLQSEVSRDRRRQDVTVSALNANNKTGRVYFQDLRRTIPFKVAKEAKARTTLNLSRYLTRYVNGANEWFDIEFIPYHYSDGRLKRIVIFDCERATDE